MSKDVYILAIESSCDETACSIVKNGSEILSNVVNSQIDVHTLFGGVVPEVASRIHVENIAAVCMQAVQNANITMDQVDAIAVTIGPGLIGSLHVGVLAAKTLAWIYNKPLIPVHHLTGHIYANAFVDKLQFPLLALVVSGGHTELVLMKEDYDFKIIGSTQDDAIGEAYDKVARVLGLGYPGGPPVDKHAKLGQPVYKLAKPKLDNPLDFSFSGLKSSVLQSIKKIERENETVNVDDMCASFQETALQFLLSKVELALQQYDIKQVVLAGGVAANSRLRELTKTMMETKYPNISYIIPPLSCCTDNAAMIGASGYIAYLKNRRASLDVAATATMEIQ